MTVRTEHIGPHTLILGDCREVLPTLGKVDHIITDPPFSLRTHSGHDSTSERATRDGSVRKSLGYEGLTDEAAAELATLYARQSAVWLTDHLLAPVVRRAFEAEGRAVFPPLPFFHPGRSCRLSGDGPSSWTDWMVCSRTKALRKWGTLPGGYVAGTGWKDKEHMGGKPLPLMSLVVRDYSMPGETVCDPCMGAATTIVAAMKHGRKAIGIEIDPQTFETACRRVEEAMRQPDLFVETPPAPVQTSIFDAAE
jgi:site-specific DNA-methyltransferase (adenine-specific)